MGYYMRVFCTRSELPDVAAAVEAARKNGLPLHVTAGPTSSDPDEWEADVAYGEERSPLVVAASFGKSELLREERDEFVEFLEDVPASPEKSKVLDHLAATRAIVAVQLLADADELGAAAGSSILRYYAETCGGLIQADLEGFYEGDDLIVALE